AALAGPVSRSSSGGDVCRERPVIRLPAQALTALASLLTDQAALETWRYAGGVIVASPIIAWNRDADGSNRSRRPLSRQTRRYPARFLRRLIRRPDSRGLPFGDDRVRAPGNGRPRLVVSRASRSFPATCRTRPGALRAMRRPACSQAFRRPLLRRYNPVIAPVFFGHGLLPCPRSTATERVRARSSVRGRRGRHGRAARGPGGERAQPWGDARRARVPRVRYHGNESKPR